MSEKLELKDIVGYLPYELKCKVTDRRKTVIATLGGLYSDGNCVFHDIVESEKGFSKIKPILRPMTDIIKPLPDGTIPIVEMWNNNLFGYNLDKKPIPSEFMCEWTLSDLMENISFDNYSRLFEYLYAHHFDINNLIGRGLAIDTNTTKIKNK